MKNNKSILDIFLENRIKENKTVLSDNLNEIMYCAKND